MEVQISPHGIVFNGETAGRLDDPGDSVAVKRDAVDIAIGNLRGQFRVIGRLQDLQRPRGRAGAYIDKDQKAHRRDPAAPDPSHSKSSDPRFHSSSSRSSNRKSPIRPPSIANTNR